MVAGEFGYDNPGVEGTIPNDAVYFVHFVFSFCLFEWLNRGLGADGAASARFFWGWGFLINSCGFSVTGFPPARE